MFDIIRKALNAGLGLVDVSEKKTREFVDTLVKQGKLNKAEGKKLYKSLTDQAAESRKQIEKSMTGAMEYAVEKLDVASRRELANSVKSIEKRLVALEKFLRKQPATPKTKRAKKA